MNGGMWSSQTIYTTWISCIIVLQWQSFVNNSYLEKYWSQLISICLVVPFPGTCQRWHVILMRWLVDIAPCGVRPGTLNWGRQITSNRWRPCTFQFSWLVIVACCMHWNLGDTLWAIRVFCVIIYWPCRLGLVLLLGKYKILKYIFWIKLCAIIKSSILDLCICECS